MLYVLVNMDGMLWCSEPYMTYKDALEDAKDDIREIIESEGVNEATMFIYELTNRTTVHGAGSVTFEEIAD